MSLDLIGNPEVTTRKVDHAVASFKRCNQKLLKLYVKQNEIRMKINELKDEIEKDVEIFNLHGWNIREK